MQLDHSCLFSSPYSVNVDGITSPNLNPSKAIHQSPRVAWIRSDVSQREARKRSLQFRYFKPPKGQPVQSKQLSLGASRAQTDCTQPASVAACIMGTSQSTSGLDCTFRTQNDGCMSPLFTLIHIWVVCHQNISDSSSLCVGIPEGQWQSSSH